MQFKLKLLSSVFLVLAAMSAAQSPVTAQAPATDGRRRVELAVDYSFLRSNAPPGGSGGFSLNGGSATFALPVRTGIFAVVGDVSFGHTSDISRSGYALTLSAFTGGVRYRPRLGHMPVQPFAQLLLGVAHADGSLVQGLTPATANAGAAFAANLGGGVDLRLSRRFSIRMIEADYLVTTFDNGVNDHQNILRIDTGLLFHF